MATVASTLVKSGDEHAMSGGGRHLWRAMTANRKVLLGLIVAFFFCLLALVGPLFVGSDPNAFGLDRTAPPSCAHPRRSTTYGQAVLAQLAAGDRVSAALG